MAQRRGFALLLVLFFCSATGLLVWHQWYRASMLHNAAMLCGDYYARWYKLNAVLDCVSVEVAKNYGAALERASNGEVYQRDYTHFYNSLDEQGRICGYQVLLRITQGVGHRLHIVVDLCSATQVLCSVGHVLEKKGARCVATNYQLRSDSL